MAFALVKINQGRINQPEPEYFTLGDTYPANRGDALQLSSGKLVPAGANTDGFTALFIAMADGLVKETIPVCRVTPEMLFETTFSADSTSVALSDKVTLNVDGTSGRAIGVTATKTKGVATVVEKFGNASGATVHVRFEPVAPTVAQT